MPRNFSPAVNGFGPFLAACSHPGRAELPHIAGPVRGNRTLLRYSACLGPATGSPVLDATGTAQNSPMAPGGETHRETS